jgi:succinate dehydrogenase flavin-adding protein (antitoxin of CptAB toxin-antitoxin module)
LLELDLWLGGFWSAHRATLQAHEVDAFTCLLALSDMEIMDRLQGRVNAEDGAQSGLVRRLQQFRAVTLLEAP